MGDTEKKTGTEPASAAKRKKLSVVVSVYNEEAALPLFYRTAGSIDRLYPVVICDSLQAGFIGA